MIIGVDATCWANKRGFGRFTRELLEAVLKIDRANEYLFFLDRKTAEREHFPDNAKVVAVETRVAPAQAASADGNRSLRDLWAMSRAASNYKMDVFFFPAVYSYFPLSTDAKIIVTIHDLIADRHPKLIFPNYKSRLFWKIKQNLAVWQADSILTVSQFSKWQIADYFDFPDSKIRVICEGARPIFKKLPHDRIMAEKLAKYKLAEKENFLLYVGGISPHKNLSALIEAFVSVKTALNSKNLKLVLVGDYKDDPFFSAYPSLKKQIAELKLENSVLFTGFVPDEDLVYLYNAAQLLVFPSLEEGFGLPAIEAMACGTPVAASRGSSLPEVLGVAGRFFDPRNSSEMAETIIKILSCDSLRKLMSSRGLIRAEEFQWKKAAFQLLEIFDELKTAESPTASAHGKSFVTQRFLQ
jgi:glycosyltransferase involved in cell wall biosynthesis